jgi:hypothetical protein
MSARAEINVRNRRRRRRAAFVGLATAVIVAGSASAYWKGRVSGSGPAKIGVGVTVTTNATPAQGAKLYPGGVAVPITLQINRPGTTKVRISTFAPRIGAITADAAHAGCVGSNGVNANQFITVGSQSGLAIDVFTATPVTTTIDGMVQMTIAAPNACQGATFTIPVLLTGVIVP